MDAALTRDMQIADTGGESSASALECQLALMWSDALDSQQVIHSSRQSAASRIEWLVRPPRSTLEY